MMYQPRPPLVKNKLFCTFLILGILSVVTEIILFFYFLAQVGECIGNFSCLDQGLNLSLCLVDTRVYCCGSALFTPYSCGSWQGQCLDQGDFLDCTPRLVALWVLGWASFIFLVLMCLTCAFHYCRKQQRELYLRAPQ